MNDRDPILEMTFKGSAIGPGAVSMSSLGLFFSKLTRAFQCTSRVLQEQSAKAHGKKLYRKLMREVDFDLVYLGHGSPTAVLGFARSERQECLPGLESQFETSILDASLRGLDAIGKNHESGDLPDGFSPAVLRAWRDAGVILDQGIEQVDLVLVETSVKTEYSRPVRDQVQERIRLFDAMKSEIKENFEIEGTLVMVDFQDKIGRCRVLPSSGNPVKCTFGNSLEHKVRENLLETVRITGEVTRDSHSGRILSMEIQEIQHIDDGKFSKLFWNSPTLEELARLQNVKPIQDLSRFFGKWPGKINDGFEEEIYKLKYPNEEYPGE